MRAARQRGPANVRPRANMSDKLRLDSVWRSIGWALIAFVAWQSLKHDPIEVPIGEGNFLGHLGAYATLMLWFAQIVLPGRARVACASGFFLMGFGLEAAQGLTDYRTFDLFDAGANLCGVLLGWLLAPPRLPNFLRGAERYLPANWRI